MLKLVARSKRGHKQIQRHGDLWVPVATCDSVGCLGGEVGIRIQSCRTWAFFWYRTRDDENFVVVDRLNDSGKSVLVPTVDNRGSSVALSGVSIDAGLVGVSAG